MGCKYVKDFKFDSDFGYTGSTGKTEVKGYMRGGCVDRGPGRSKMPEPMPRPAPGGKSNAAGAQRSMRMADGGSSYMCGGKAEMKKGGKSKSSPAKKSRAKASRSSKRDEAMAEAVLGEMLAQADMTGRMPGVPMQGRPMPAPRARAVPVASQAPLVAMKSGGMSKGQQAKVGRVMGEYKRGELHSGSKSGPVVKNRDQAVAIAMNEARKKKA